MKKLILAAFAVTAAVSVFAQGTVAFVGNGPLGTTHIWGPSSTTPTLSLVGLASNDRPTAGTVDYAGSGMTLIGATGNTGKYGAATTFAQMLGGPAGTAESSLLPAAGTTTFRSGTPAGVTFLVTATMGNVPVDALSAVVEAVAWDNSSGNYATWAQASVAWLAGTIAAGKSGPVTVANIGGSANNPPNWVYPSFNLYFLSTVPEPSSFALAGLGAAALLIFRRRK